MAIRLIAWILHRASHAYSKHPATLNLCRCDDTFACFEGTFPTHSLSDEEQRRAEAFRWGCDPIAESVKVSWITILSKQLSSASENPERYVTMVSEIKFIQSALEKASGIMKVLWKDHYALWPSGVSLSLSLSCSHALSSSFCIHLFISAFDSRFIDKIVGMFHLNNCTWKILHPVSPILCFLPSSSLSPNYLLFQYSTSLSHPLSPVPAVCGELKRCSQRYPAEAEGEVGADFESDTHTLRRRNLDRRSHLFFASLLPLVSPLQMLKRHVF
jgi:hypothetical protein